MKKLLYLSFAAICLFVLLGTNAEAIVVNGVEWTYKGVTVSEYDPTLKHFVWEAARPPFGPWDKIALHRYVRQEHSTVGSPYKPAKSKTRVLFIIPGTWDRGQHKGFDPNVSEDWFFAANGYDVYSLDFRTAYIPNLAYEQFEAAGLSEYLTNTRDWTYEVFREDIKACVDLAIRISRAYKKKLFLAGRSRGGLQMWMYAAKYSQDLKGLISLDGGGPYVLEDTNPGKQMTVEQYTTLLNLFRNGQLPTLPKYLLEVGGYELGQFAAAVPYSTSNIGGPLPTPEELDPPIPAFAPDDKKGIDFVSDYLAYRMYYTWGAGNVTNYYRLYPGGNGETYMDREVLVGIAGNFTRYWPAVQQLQSLALANYDNNPYLDLDDTQSVNLPILFFASMFGCASMGACYQPDSPVGPGQEVVARTASTDITQNIYYDPDDPENGLNYGHLDIYSGTHAREDVMEPMLAWMEARLK